MTVDGADVLVEPQLVGVNGLRGHHDRRDSPGRFVLFRRSSRQHSGVANETPPPARKGLPCPQWGKAEKGRGALR